MAGKPEARTRSQWIAGSVRAQDDSPGDTAIHFEAERVADGEAYSSFPGCVFFVVSDQRRVTHEKERINIRKMALQKVIIGIRASGRYSLLSMVMEGSRCGS